MGVADIHGVAPGDRIDAREKSPIKENSAKRLAHGFRSWIREAVDFAVDGTMMVTAPPGTLRLRWILWFRVAVGGVLGRVFHSLRIPFQWTPLFAVPFALAGAWLHYEGLLWLGVLCSFIVAISDIADGVATGWVIDAMPKEQRPRRRMATRRFLDTFVVDPVSRFALYGVFAIRLHEEQTVSGILILLLLAIELVNVVSAGKAESTNRRDELFYEFVLDAQGEARHRPFYYLRVAGGHLSAYHGYALLPLLGYLAPLSDYGAFFFFAVLAIRSFVFLARIKMALCNKNGLPLPPG